MSRACELLLVWFALAAGTAPGESATVAPPVSGSTTTRTLIAPKSSAGTTTAVPAPPVSESTTTRTLIAHKSSTGTTTTAVPPPPTTKSSTTTTKPASGVICDVPFQDWLADSYCDSDHGNYNTLACAWDGGDCCVDTCVTQVNKSFSCGTPEFSCRDPASPYFVDCPLRTSGFWGDGFCDQWNNALEAQEGSNYVNLNSRACGWDGGDCCRETCSQPLEKGGGSCTYTMENCLDPAAPDACDLTVAPGCDVFEGCAASYPSYIGDGWCDDDEHNVAACGWDGGDCCETTCLLWHRPGTNECGVSSPYACLDPSAVMDFTGRPVTVKPSSSTTNQLPLSTTVALSSGTTTPPPSSSTTAASTSVAPSPVLTATTSTDGSGLDRGRGGGGQDGSSGDTGALDDKTVVGIAVGVAVIVIVAGIAVGIAVAVKKSRSQRKNSSFGAASGSPFVRAHATSMRAEDCSAYATLDEPMSNQGVNI